MRIPVPLAWVLVLLSFFTAGLLRQFHDRTPHSPYVPPVVGSLLFAAIVFLLLVAAREFRRGAVPGPGVRLGSLTPLLLMLLIEKWVSLALYNPIFYFLRKGDGEPALLDAQFAAFAGMGLILVSLVLARLSAPTARKAWRRARPGRLPVALAAGAVVIAGTYLLLGMLASALGGGLSLEWPPATALTAWNVGGQTLIAIGEEIYYRGLLMSEVERLAPRLGIKSAAGRRWTALLTTSGLFAMEHLQLSTQVDVMARQILFTFALGILLGLLVMVSANLNFAAIVHAWINWLLLGAAPLLVDVSGRPALPSGTYIAVLLVLAFLLAYVVQRLQLHPLWSRRRARPG